MTSSPSSEPQEVASRSSSVAPRLCENAKNRASTRFAGSGNGGDSTTPQTWNLGSLDPVAGQDFEIWLGRFCGTP